jgi:hypothetical protein
MAIFLQTAINEVNLKPKLTSYHLTVRPDAYKFRVWDRGDPSCQHNPDLTGQCPGVVQSNSHLLAGVEGLELAEDFPPLQHPASRVSH